MNTRDMGDFDEFYAARVHHMRRIAYVILHDWQLAEDAVQAAFVKVYLGWHRIRPPTLEAYVRKAVVNASISQLRKRRREVASEDIAQLPIEDLLPEPDVMQRLSRLPTAQRAVLALRFLDDMSVADVAQVLSISEGTVKSHTSRGLHALRRDLEKHPRSN